MCGCTQCTARLACKYITRGIRRHPQSFTHDRTTNLHNMYKEWFLGPFRPPRLDPGPSRPGWSPKTAVVLPQLFVPLQEHLVTYLQP